LKCLVADGQELGLSAEVFDRIIVSEVLEHVPIPEKLLAEAFRVLKPGGKLMISVPNAEKIALHLCVHCNRKTPANAHLHSFEKASLGDLLEKQGFRIVKSFVAGNFALDMLGFYALSFSWPFRLWRFIDNAVALFVKKNNYLYMNRGHYENFGFST